MSARPRGFSANPSPPSVNRLTASLCAGAGKNANANIRLNSCAVAHLRRRVATGTDFVNAPIEIAPVLDHVKSFVSDALSDGELSPREVAGLYDYVSEATQRLVEELDESDSPDWIYSAYDEYESDLDILLKDRQARDLEVKRAIAARRKRVLQGIKVLTSMTMAGGLIYALINTADNTEPLIPQKTWSDTMAELAFLAATWKMN